MNEKNKGKRQNVSLDRKWHRRFKILAVRADKTLEELIDEAAAAYLRQPVTMIRGTGE